MNHIDRAIMQTADTLYFSSSAEKPLAYSERGPISLGTFRSDVQRLTDQLENPGDVLLTCPGRYGFAVALLASWLKGKAAILPPNQLEHTLTAIREEYPLTFECDLDWGQRLADPRADHAHGEWNVDLTANSTAVKIFTSGSSGDPKVIHKSIANLLEEARVIRDCFEWPRGPIVASVTPQHLYGLTFSLMLPWVSNLPWIDHTPLFTQDLLQTLKETGAGTFISVPAQYRALLEEEADLRGLMCVSAAAPLNKQTATQWQQQFGAQIMEIYGSTETGVVAFRHTKSSETWTPFPQVKLSAKKELLWVQSPFMSPAWEAGFQTADHVTLNNDGAFILHGRADSIVKIAGKRVSLTNIEKHLLANPEITDAAVIAVPSKGLIRDNTLWAAVVAQYAHNYTAKTLQSLLRKKLDGIEIPRRIVFVEKLPRKANGKLPRKELEKLLGLNQRV